VLQRSISAESVFGYFWGAKSDSPAAIEREGDEKENE